MAESAHEIAPTEAWAEVPRAPLGHLARLGFVLAAADDVDEIARSVISDLAALPGVRRVGFALTEGGGRRLRFTASDGVPEADAEDAQDAEDAGTDGRDGEAGESVDLRWCHIDAYDDVPLTAVVRTGAPIMGSVAQLERRYAELIAGQREATEALAAVPMPGASAPIGGLLLYFDAPQDFAGELGGLLEAAARSAADAVRRVRHRHAGEPDVQPEPAYEGRSVVLALPDDPRAPSEARRFLRRKLQDWGVPDELTDTAQLLTSELVTNAVNHAGTASEMRVTIHDHVLTVLLRDRGGSGPTAQPRRDEDPMVVHGRGLMIVEALSQHWGADRDAAGTTVWFTLELAELTPLAG